MKDKRYPKYIMSISTLMKILKFWKFIFENLRHVHHDDLLNF